MIANRGTLRGIQQEFYDLLTGETFFADIAVVIRDDGDIAKLIEQATARIRSTANKTGAFIIIGMPDPGAAARDVTQAAGTPSAYFPVITTTLLIVENLLSNRGTRGTGKPWLTIGEAVVATLQRPRIDGQLPPRYCSGPRPAALVEGEDPEQIAKGLVEVTTEGWATAQLTNAAARYP